MLGLIRRSNRRHGSALWPLALFSVLSFGLACSLGDISGPQPQGGPTPTVAQFATTTPGGRVSVWLITPTGASGRPSPTAAPFGSIVAPAASATAAYATLQAATATAGAAQIVPAFQPKGCPAPADPLPPTRPALFDDYPQTIGLYLSAGGAPTTLEATLRSWGALNGPRGVVQADTDLTGDGVPEVIVTVLDPARYNSNGPSPGQLLVYGCAQGGYRLLYSTSYSPQTMLPELKRVGNMNGGTLAQLVYAQQLCPSITGPCTQTAQILNWDTLIGAFTPLNDVPIDATNANKIKISDIDGDGILEISLIYQPTPDASAGPPRPYTVVWDWNGKKYVRALVQLSAPIYRIHEAYDADWAFEQGDFSAALKLYDKVRNDQNLLPWLDPNEPTTLRAYAQFRKLLAYAALRQTHNATDALATIQNENPPGSPAEGWAELASAFMDAYQKFRGLHKVCGAALDFLNARPDVLAAMNNYGYINHTYTPAEICPF